MSYIYDEKQKNGELSQRLVKMKIVCFRMLEKFNSLCTFQVALWFMEKKKHLGKRGKQKFHRKDAF